MQITIRANVTSPRRNNCYTLFFVYSLTVWNNYFLDDPDEFHRESASHVKWHLRERQLRHVRPQQEIDHSAITFNLPSILPLSPGNRRSLLPPRRRPSWIRGVKDGTRLRPTSKSYILRELYPREGSATSRRILVAERALPARVRRRCQRSSLSLSLSSFRETKVSTFRELLVLRFRKQRENSLALDVFPFFFFFFFWLFLYIYGIDAEDEIRPVPNYVHFDL